MGDARAQNAHVRQIDTESRNIQPNQTLRSVKRNIAMSTALTLRDDGNAQGETPESRPITLRSDAHHMRALEETGIDALCGMVESGMTLAEIAKRLGVQQASIYRWLDRFGYRQQYARALEDSAEALADRGLEALQSADESSSASVNAKRAIEDHFRWRAGVRNRRYSEKQQVELTGANGGPVQSLVTVYVPANNRDERVIDAE